MEFERSNNTSIPIEKSKKISKRRKNYKPPKKNKTAYIFFTIQTLNCLKIDYPNLTLQDLLKEIASKWSKLTTLEKKPFEELAKQDKIRYLEEKKKIIPTTRNINKNTRSSPFLLFSKEIRPLLKKELGNVNCSVIMKEIGLRWNNLSDEDKKKFDDKYQNEKKKDKDNKNKEISNYFQTYKKKKNLFNKFKNTPFTLFCKKQRNLNKEKTKTVYELANLWNSMDLRQKELFYKEYRNEKDEYLKKLPKNIEKNENTITKTMQNKKEKISNFFQDCRNFLALKKSLKQNKPKGN